MLTVLGGGAIIMADILAFGASRCKARRHSFRDKPSEIPHVQCLANEITSVLQNYYLARNQFKNSCENLIL